MSEFGTWLGDTFVTVGRDLMTVLPNGTLEIRGESWGKRRGAHPGEDHVRVCRIGDPAQARRIAEEIAQILHGNDSN